jgi:hypothetical protein
MMGFAIASSPRVLNKLALQTSHKAASGCKGLFGLVANRVGRAGAWWHIPKMHPQRPPEVPRPNADAIDTRHMRSASYVGAGIWKRCQMFTANCGEWRTPTVFERASKPGGEERTNFPGLVIELSLAHRVGNAVENAYRRGDVIVKRRKLMEAWATFCCTPPTVTGEVVSLKKEASA